MPDFARTGVVVVALEVVPDAKLYKVTVNWYRVLPLFNDI